MVRTFGVLFKNSKHHSEVKNILLYCLLKDLYAFLHIKSLISLGLGFVNDMSRDLLSLICVTNFLQTKYRMIYHFPTDL